MKGVGAVPPGATVNSTPADGAGPGWAPAGAGLEALGPACLFCSNKGTSFLRGIGSPGAWNLPPEEQQCSPGGSKGGRPAGARET